MVWPPGGAAAAALHGAADWGSPTSLGQFSRIPWVSNCAGQRKLGSLHLFETFSPFHFGCQHEVGAPVPARPSAAVSRSAVLAGAAQCLTTFLLQSSCLAQQHNTPLTRDGSWFVQPPAEHGPEVHL